MCDVFVEVGFVEYFVYCIGYGIGLCVYEEFYIVVGNDLVLVFGMVFFIELGIYFLGWWGVCIEDIVIVIEDGVVFVNNCLYELIVVLVF